MSSLPGSPDHQGNPLPSSADRPSFGAEHSLALALGGGGARGAYQAGVLRGLARCFPHLRFPILTGVSAGAVNTVHLASHTGTLEQSTEALVNLWLSLTPEKVFEVNTLPLARNMLRWALRLVGGGMSAHEPRRGLVNTAPLRRFLSDTLQVAPDAPIAGIRRNIDSGALRAVALTATSYSTGQSVTWIEGRDIEPWQRPQRRTHATSLTVDHIMASSAIPMLFPAVRIRDEWYGDGGVRLTAPLSPALHLGATRIIAISTRYAGTIEEASVRAIDGYPSPAQVLGILFNAVFLDQVDEDIRRLNTVNQLLRRVPPEQRGGLREVDNLVIRPSRDLGRIARKFEPRLPGFFRYLTRGLGTRSSRSADMLSLILFQEDYLRVIMQLGEEDAERDAGRIEAFLADAPHASGSFASQRLDRVHAAGP